MSEETEPADNALDWAYDSAKPNEHPAVEYC